MPNYEVYNFLLSMDIFKREEHKLLQVEHADGALCSLPRYLPDGGNRFRAIDSFCIPYFRLNISLPFSFGNPSY
eukprot:4299351-Pleurochrysis_carterae.AAC.1